MHVHIQKTDFICKIFDKKESGTATFVDLEKALGRVEHVLPIDKMEKQFIGKSLNKSCTIISLKSAG